MHPFHVHLSSSPTPKRNTFEILIVNERWLLGEHRRGACRSNSRPNVTRRRIYASCVSSSIAIAGKAAPCSAACCTFAEGSYLWSTWTARLLYGRKTAAARRAAAYSYCGGAHDVTRGSREQAERSKGFAAKKLRANQPLEQWSTQETQGNKAARLGAYIVYYYENVDPSSKGRSL
jgi:hypothetical protein